MNKQIFRQNVVRLNQPRGVPRGLCRETVERQRTRSLLDCSIHITWPFIRNSSDIHLKFVWNCLKFIWNLKFSQIYPKIQPFLPTSQSFKYCKYQIKHTQFIIIIYIYSKFIPKFNLLSLYLSHSSTVKIQKIPNFPKCIRNASQIYPKFNLLSLHLSHSNTVNIKSSIHSSS